MQHNFQIVNTDTDSCSFCKPDMSPFTEEEQIALLKEINELLPELIRMEHDGIYDKVIVVKAKNYILKRGDKTTIKGSGLKGSMKEAKLQQFMRDLITLMLEDKVAATIDLYNDYAYEICNITDILPWSFRKTVTKTLWTSQRSNETRVWDAIKHLTPQEGDKLNLYFKDDGLPCLASEYKGDHDRKRMLDKLRDTLEIFENVLDKNLYPNYSLKKNKLALEDLLNRKSGKELMGE